MDYVSVANRQFYNRIAHSYDVVDRRRAKGEFGWVEAQISEIASVLRKIFANEPLKFLDAGAGSGLLADLGTQYFDSTVVLDISHEMLLKVEVPGVTLVEADCNALPFADKSLHCIGGFALLHHLLDPRTFFSECARVLKPGGIVFTDHDIERRFVGRFRAPLQCYRFFFDHKHRYLKACPNLTSQDYHLTEFHGDNGVPSAEILAHLKSCGLTADAVHYHWKGMGIFDTLVGRLGIANLLDRPGWSPIFQVVAHKT
jgi:ubiquinone/menaquinone biosynthesis C-methylase UbiE